MGDEEGESGPSGGRCRRHLAGGTQGICQDIEYWRPHSDVLRRWSARGGEVSQTQFKVRYSETMSERVH